MSTRNFYRDLIPIESFQQATDTKLHQSLPSDWIIILTDVMGSTLAIEKGRYKDVNTIGAATIMGIVNVDRSTQIPFVFGGDGATLAIPPHMEAGSRRALLASQKMASNVFDLHLRVALIPVSELVAEGLSIKIAKYRQSRHITQTTISGTGWQWSENILKDPIQSQRYLLSAAEEQTPEADFSGLECRWEPVDASNDFKFCVIVKCLATDQAQQDTIYRTILTEIEQITAHYSETHPLNAKNLRLSLNPFELYYGFRALNKSAIASATHACWLVVKSLIGRYAIKKNLKLKGVHWGQYRDELIENADYRKFDGNLKMVLDLSQKQSDLIVDILESRRRSGQINYGVSKSKRAIMTCLVFSEHQNHAHFIDGSDGGYAIAAKMLKSQTVNKHDTTKPNQLH